MVKKLNKRATTVDLNNNLTCSNLAKQLYIAAGCFDGCYQIKGLVRKFIEKCVVGGRVMTNNNEMTFFLTKSYNCKDNVPEE